jgi:hypothetical protein
VPDLEIKLIGNKTDKNRFTAKEIRPWHGHKKNQGNGKRQGKMHQSMNNNL